MSCDMIITFITSPSLLPTSNEAKSTFKNSNIASCLTTRPQAHLRESSKLPRSVDVVRFLSSIAMAGFVSFTTPAHLLAVSGGGLDYASKDYTNGQFADGDYEGKDFSGGTFKFAKFANAKLKNARFFKADLREADMRGADLSFATLEGGYLKGLDLGNAILKGAYTSDSIADVANLEGADFEDCLVPTFLLPKLCDRADAKGVNPVTQVNTRESLMCPD